MSVNFEYYKVFYEVAKYGNITMAAKSLFLTQSTVSRSIQHLENELGVRLFERSKKGVVLTDVGSILFYHISQAYEHISVGEERVEMMRGFKEGMLRIGTVEMIMKFFLLSMIRAFKKEFPDIRMDYSFQDPAHVAEALNTGLLDVAILTTPVDQDDRIEVVPWMEFSDVIVAGNQYSELKEKPLDLKELTSYPFISMREGMSMRTYTESLFLEKKLKFEPMYESQSLPFIMDLVREGYGIACVPEYYAKEPVDAGEVFTIELTDPLPVRDICIVTSKVIPGSLVRDEFVKIITK